MITTNQIELVQRSFARVLPIADAAGLMFYNRLFELVPATRSLFGDDIPLQAGRTMAAVKKVVDGLDDLEPIAAYLARLGARHVGYGVAPVQLGLAADVLLWTLEQGLGDHFTAEVREAWIAATDIITAAMRAGMEQAGAVTTSATLITT